MTTSEAEDSVFWTPNRIKWAVVALCIVLLVIVLSLIIALSIVPNDQKDKTICVPCYVLSWSGDNDLTGFEKRNESDTDYMMCCNEGSKVLDILIKKHVVSKHKDSTQRISSTVGDECNGQHTDNKKPHVKMTGINFTAMTNDRDNIIRWNSTIYEGCINPQNGKIFIKEPGHYLVFSNLKLQIPITDSCIVHNHEVFMQSYTPSPMIVILEKSQTFCEITFANRETTSTVEAEFYFEEYDKLFVRSSHPQHLVSSEYSNTFALHKTRR